MTIIIQKESDTKEVKINSKGKVSDANPPPIISKPSDGKERNNITFSDPDAEDKRNSTRDPPSTLDLPFPSSDALKTPLPIEKEPDNFFESYYSSSRDYRTEEKESEPMSSMPAGFESIANPEKVEIPEETPEFDFSTTMDQTRDKDKESYGDRYTSGYNDDLDKSERVSLSETIPKPDYYSDFYRSDNNRYERKDRERDRREKKDSDDGGSRKSKRYHSSDDSDGVTEEQEKGYLLYLLEQMKAKGVHVSRDFSMNSRLKDIKKEYQRIKSRMDAEKSIKFQREMLFTFCSGIEYVNQAYDPFGLDLDGWPNQVHDSIEMYDDVFARLHEKYSKKVSKVPPELQLVGMLGMSAIAFNISKKMFAEPSPPPPSKTDEMSAMRNMLMKNPDMMKRFIQETTERAIPPRTTGGQAKDAYGRDFMPNQPSSGPPPVQKKEMRGPAGVDDILKKMKSGYLSSGSEKSKRNEDSDGTVPNSDSDSNVKNVALKRGRRSGVSM